MEEIKENNEVGESGQASNQLDKIVIFMGFKICKWSPRPGDVCENCGKKRVQMFFSGNDDAGTYWCIDCIVNEYNQQKAYHKRIVALEKDGHTSHCAARQVYGDGECECDLKGIIPGPISMAMGKL